ncbi:MAG: 50S ribosomal protein L30 [Saprospiraceae bacterium]|jgi:large subunit ribosomal protein L30
MATIKIKYVKSIIKRPQDQKDTIFALGFRKLNQTVEHTVNPQIMGMVKKIAHLIEVQE